MKNISNPSPRQRSDQNTAMNLKQLLFMDETSADLENYLNSSLPQTSSVELKSSTINTLSKNIRGKFQKGSRDSRKNKFFKNKSLDEKYLVNPSEIPVINEAMKKILKETPHKPNLKHSPKALKTYSNKHKDKTQVVESFGLPDQPFLSVDASYSKEPNSIDLDIGLQKGNFNNSLIFGQWLQPDSVECSAININDDFRRKSFSAIENVLFGEGSLETEVKDGFNFEDDSSVHDAVKPSNGEHNGKKNKSPTVLLKSLNLNDIHMLKTNNLSPSTNRQDMLLERWQKFSSKFKNTKNFNKSKAFHKSPKYCEIAKSKVNLRRSTRSNTSSFDVEICSNSLPKNSNNTIELQFDSSSSRSASDLKDNFSPRIIEEHNEKSPKELNLKIPKNIDNLYPRRATRSAQKMNVDSLPINTSTELCSLSFKSPTGKHNINDKNLEVTSKRVRRSNPLNSSAELENTMNSPGGDDVITNSPSKIMTYITSPSNSRNIRTSLRSANASMKLRNEFQSSSSGEHNSIGNIPTNRKLNRNTMEFPNPSEELPVENSTILKVDTSLFISVPEASVGVSNHCDEINNSKKGRLNINKHTSISPSKQKNRSKITNQFETPTRKSNRLNLQSDGNPNRFDQSLEEELNSKNTPETRNKVVDINFKSAPSKENENIDVNVEILASPAQVKRSRGRPSKNKASDVQSETELRKSSQDEEVTQKLKKDTKFPENQTVSYLDKLTKNAEDLKMEISVRQHQNTEENIHDQAEPIKKTHNEIQGNEKKFDETEICNNSIIVNEGKIIPTKRRRGRPKKNIVLEKKENNSCSVEQSTEIDDTDILMENNQVVNNEKLLFNNEEKTKSPAKEWNEKKEIDKCSVISNYCEDKFETITKDHLHQLDLCKNSEIKNLAIDENQISCESDIEQVDEKKRKIHNELQILEITQDTGPDEKSGEYIDLENKNKTSEPQNKANELFVKTDPSEMFYDNKIEDKCEIDQKTKNSSIETEFRSGKQETDEVHHHSSDEKNLQDKKVDKTYPGSSEILNSFCETWRSRENNTPMNELNESNVTVEYSDFGYDIHRRTSFRKILERVMVASRLEMERAISETTRNQRSKSVPHEEIHCIIKTNDAGKKCASADSKFEYLKDKKNSNQTLQNIDISKVKKKLDYNLPLKSYDNQLLRKRAKSMHMDIPKLSGVSTHQQADSSDSLEERKSTKNGIMSTLNVACDRFDDDPKEGISESESFGANTNENVYDRTDLKKSLDVETFNVESNLRLSRRTSASYSEQDIKDNEDLEVQNLLLGKKISGNQSSGRMRSKSLLEGKCCENFKPRSKSVTSRRSKKKSRSYGGTDGSKEVVKKVHDFQAGDSVWAKIGNYPYWPALVTEDPETSNFKKFRLLRKTPYYHVRFFGDNGKRAWTIYCISYEGPQDLDKLRKQLLMEGIQNDYFVKATHLEKWKSAVEEAEMVKNYPLEKKFEFFDKVLPSKERSNNSEDTGDIITEGFERRVRSKSFSFTTNMHETNSIKSKDDLTQKGKIPIKLSSLISCIEDVVKNDTKSSSESKYNPPSPRKKSSPVKDSDTSSCNVNVAVKSVENQEKTGIETETNVPSPRKRSIPMKTSSVLACIDGVVNKYCSANAKNSDANSTKRKTREYKKKIEDADSDFDLGLELLDISLSDVTITSSQKMDSKSAEKNSLIMSPKQSNPSESPVSSRRASLISPTRTRSRSSLKIEKRRLSNEFKRHDEPQVSSNMPKANMVLSSSPRKLKLKNRTIEIGQTDTESPTSDSSFLNHIASRLPEYKKNLFRGVTKEKVCQICEEPGDVVKCRGPCNGDFHIQCVENSLKKTEELTLKEQEELISKEKSDDIRLQVDKLMDDNKQVEISTVMSRNKFPNNVILSPINRKIPIIEQFDRKMKELMSQVESGISIDSINSSSEEIVTFDKVKVDKKSKENNSKKYKGEFKHVTAEDVAVISLSNSDATKQKCASSESVEQITNADDGVYKCPYCISSVIPVCFVCNMMVSTKGNTMRQRCSLQKCGRYYHLECLNVWHQTQWSFILHDKRKSEALDNFVCPRHSCHICASENLGFSMGRCPNDKLVKCLRCPATYHNSYHCVPAGTEILTSTQIICPRHVEGNKKTNTLNTIWCFVCSEGGNLICCETCPTSVHSECLPVNLLDDDTYICEDCESGRFPLYDEVVWVKCGTFRWWPAIILFPMEIPPNVDSKPHSKGEFVVKFFGTYNYFWVGRGRAFLYQEGDTGYLNNSKNKIDEAFSRAIKEAADVYRFQKALRAKKQKEVNNGLKPPPYVRIKVNRPVGNVKVFEGNLSNTTPCDCNPKDKSPCGPNSNCLNRILLTECDPEICPAGEKCKNQAFEKREYAQVKPHRTTGRGWGLKTLEPIKKGQFVIEYVGEIIDDEEYQRRITRMHQQKDENYYFLTIDKDRMLDAGPKGNVARFMNHSCQPNCETQKWTVNSDTRVGLFAIEDIPVDTELTFNYNLECAGTEKKICRCGAPNCSGFIGLKPEDQRSLKRNSTMKPIDHDGTNDVIDLCFICGQPGDVRKCSNRLCFKSYHLECVQLDRWPKGLWSCPSHTCNNCSKRTATICILCNNSYCSRHSEGNIRHDSSLGFLCNQHEPATKKSRRKKTTTGRNVESSTSICLNTSQNRSLLEDVQSETLRSERYRKRTSCFETNIPLKKLKLNN